MSAPRVRLKYACVSRGQYGLNYPATGYVDEGVRLIRTTDLAEGKLSPAEMGIYVPEEAVDGESRLAPGDILLSRSGTIGRAFLAPAATEGMAFAGFLVRFRPRPDTLGKYLYYCTQSSEFQAAVVADAVSSTIQNFNAEKYENLTVPLPPLEEQQTIVDYLDRETQRIDELIAKQRGLIETLRERRRAVIDAVSLGDMDPLDSQAAGKWPVAAVGYGFSVMLGKMLDAGKKRDERSSDLPYIRAGNIQDEGLRLSAVNEMPFTPEEAAKFSLKRDDLLVVEGGAIGTCVVLDEDMPGWAFQKTVNRLRPSLDWSSRYYRYVITAYRDRGVLDIISNKSTIAHFTAEKLRGLRVPVPPVEEQHDISAYLDDQTSRIDALIAESEDLISLSQERRAALITAAVTGQIDVGTAA